MHACEYQRPGLVHSGYARVYFAHSVDVYRYGYTGIAVVALPVYAGRMSPRSGMVSNAGGQEGCGKLTLAPIMQVHNCITGTMYRG